MTVTSRHVRVRGATLRSRAAALGAPGRFDVIERAVPSPGAREVRVRLEGSGVCGSSLPVYEGRAWFDYPLEPGMPGHEGWGHVDSIGADVEHVEVGQRVALLSYGAHAEHDLAAADALVPLPAELGDGPFPGEPLGCAMNVFERSDVRAGHTVAVVGTGFLGMLLVQLCVAAGARVLALGRRVGALELARSLGAAEAIPIGAGADPAERVLELTDGGGCERVIEAVGLQEPLTLAGRLAGVRARLVIAGFHQDGPRTIDLQRWNWNGLDVINAHERDPARYVEGMRAAVDAVATGRIVLEPLITHTLPLDRIGEAYALMRDRPEGFLKAVLAS